MEPNLFCYPLAPVGGPHDIKLCLSTEDRDMFDQLPPDQNERSIVVTDRASGLKYNVRRHPCGERCYCGAQAWLAGTVERT